VAGEGWEVSRGDTQACLLRVLYAQELRCALHHHPAEMVGVRVALCVDPTMLVIVQCMV
jgi:hypothetical protein